MDETAATAARSATEMLDKRRILQAVDALDVLGTARGDDEAARLAAERILALFDTYQAQCRDITWRAKAAFEKRHARQSLYLSRRRLTVYSETVRLLVAKLREVFPRLVTEDRLWPVVEAAYERQAVGRYADDLAIAFLHSVRRILYKDEWKPVEYSFGAVKHAADTRLEIWRTFAGGTRFTTERVAEILTMPGFAAPFEDLMADAEMVAKRLNHDLELDGSAGAAFAAVHVIESGFYRNRGAYLLGRVEMADGHLHPIAISLENHTAGIFVDAVLTREAHLHNLFSSTLANFHVTVPYYHELAHFLHSMMPRRPLGLHYSTIGFNHVGKVAVAEEIRDGLAAAGEPLDTAAGFRGTVAIGFTAPGLAYVLKVIRDHPTPQYKWGAFPGVEAVLGKYRRVHEINRAGSMLDNLIYHNIRLAKDWFAPALREELLEYCGDTVTAQGDDLIFRDLIVQMKMVPLPVFLETASMAHARRAVENLGHCIRNNAAANIFNRDLDARNYGVGRFLKVHLFDYDAVEDLTDVKIRTNVGHFDAEGDDDPPEWFFEDGVVFLPEEMLPGLRIEDRELRRHFAEQHGELMATDYWHGVQRALSQGLVPRLRVYPDECRLRTRDTDYSRA